MARAEQPDPGRFVVGVLAANDQCLQAAQEALDKEWGPADLVSRVYPFTYTEYYSKQIGPDILRAFFSFPGPFDPGDLASRKVRTNAIEEELAAACESDFPRPVNLDPGYLVPDKLVLASAKNFAHRIYLAHGIYAEITLLYRHNRFEPLEWTFPDYASGDYDEFFLNLRRRLMEERSFSASDAVSKTPLTLHPCTKGHV